MKRFSILIVLLLAGCGESDHEALERIKGEVNSSGIMTDEQLESLERLAGLHLELNGLIAVTDEEVERLVGEGKWELLLNGLTTITNEQAESLSKVQYLEISDSCQKLVD